MLTCSQMNGKCQQQPMLMDGQPLHALAPESCRWLWRWTARCTSWPMPLTRPTARQNGATACCSCAAGRWSACLPWSHGWAATLRSSGPTCCSALHRQGCSCEESEREEPGRMGIQIIQRRCVHSCALGLHAQFLNLSLC